MNRIMLAVIVLLAASPILAQYKAGRTDTSKNEVMYTCPMHPEVVSNQPGKCPKCGMELNLSPKEEMKAKIARAYSCPVHKEVSSHDPGKCPQCGRKMISSAKEQMKAEVTKLYTCPMHPEVALDKEGKCPKCGAALIEKKEKS